ncbi:uncharacterized protein TNCV_2674581 [Trichonephila clavipes]|nr:uncharacterized protein TNCV_2674581 [Trichonephila clavipes]
MWTWQPSGLGYRIVVGLFTSSSPVPQKTHRVGQRYALNLSRAQTSSRWCGVVVRREGRVPAQVLSKSFDHGSKLRNPSPKALVCDDQCDVNIHSLTHSGF